jgi:hypothetical protein
MGKPEGGRPLGRPRRRWDDDIKMDIRKVGSEGMDWIDLAQVRDRWLAIVNAVMNHRVPYNAGNFLTEDLFSLSGRTLFHGVSNQVSTVCTTTPYYIFT